jgi:Kef-type K+ transport system membrane component KefB
MGVHAICGAYLLGLAMPRYGPMRRRLEQLLEAVVLQLLLPLFFAISGLNTAIGSINTLPLIFTSLLVLAVAVGGKFIGTWATAKLSGVANREAQALGWLMHARGLTKLVILNVGLGLALFSPELFTIGVVMPRHHRYDRPPAG